jgi:ATPase subunit of ABC transporter with duplicated ATPase domains
MIILQNISYIHANKDLLFDNINLTVNHHDKIALIGKNGVGKSTLLKIISGDLQAADGQVHIDLQRYDVPQIYGQYNHLTIAQALRIEDKINALETILGGNATEEMFNLLDNDWAIEERCREALDYWKLGNLGLNEKMQNLSGGQKTKVFLAGISIHQPDLVLLDEPSNHLDTEARALLYDFIQSTPSTLIIVSHDRKLLNLLDKVCELGPHGIKVYGGNYDFYVEQKSIENNALNQDLKSKGKALKKAKEKEHETMERQQKLDARGKKKQEQSGLPTISMNTFKNNAEKSTSKIKNVHAEKIGGISNDLHNLRKELPDIDTMKFGFDHSILHHGKILFKAAETNHSFGIGPLWAENIHIQISSGERIALKGLNGSGKTTLIKMFLGKLEPDTGTIYRANIKPVYIDQDYSLINNQLNVYGQAQEFNTSLLQEHEIKTRLNRFLFPKADWDKPCDALSGGEKMRLMLCCLNIGNKAPDMIILDEPTNNLDIQNIEILTAAINEYHGTLIVVSHDEYFLEQINIKRTFNL